MGATFLYRGGRKGKEKEVFVPYRQDNRLLVKGGEDWEDERVSGLYLRTCRWLYTGPTLTSCNIGCSLSKSETRLSCTIAGTVELSPSRVALFRPEYNKKLVRLVYHWRIVADRWHYGTFVSLLLNIPSVERHDPGKADRLEIIGL